MYCLVFLLLYLLYEMPTILKSANLASVQYFSESMIFVTIMVIYYKLFSIYKATLCMCVYKERFIIFTPLICIKFNLKNIKDIKTNNKHIIIKYRNFKLFFENNGFYGDIAKFYKIRKENKNEQNWFIS